MNENFIKNKRKRNHPKKDTCHFKQLLETHGNIYVYNFTNENKHKLFINRLKEVRFIVDDELFRKGRVNNDIPEYESLPNENFWHQRYYFFSKYDDGIKMDYESWYSVTPEEISEYIARNLKGKVIVDAFCGCGGNTIQFSLYGKHVYAVDINHNKIDLCKNNTRVYGCKNNIDFICSDFLKINDGIKADVVFLSPPWGGTEYKSEQSYSLKDWIEPNIYDIIKVSKKISKNLMFYLPRNTNIEELFSILSELNTDEDETLFAEVKMLESANKIKAILVCIGDEYNHVYIFNLDFYKRYYKVFDH